MDLHLDGKTVLVTGASKGIGLACARLLAEEGCNLHLSARTEADLARARDEIAGRYNVSVQIHPMDIGAPGNAAKLAEACADIDILVNNAGAIPGGTLLDIDEERWRSAWDLKVFGYVNLCRAVYPRFKALGKGVIVNVIGAAGERPRRDYIAGSAGNASLMAFTRALGAAGASDGIRVVACNPRAIKTERMVTLMRSRAQEKFGDADRWEEMVPTDPPPGESRHVADLVAFLASDRAAHVNATVVTIDGGAVNK